MRVGLSAGLDPAFPSYYFRPSSNAFLSLLARVDASFVALPATLAVFSRAVGACRCAARTPRISVRHTQRQTANTRYRKTTVITPFTAASATLHSASDICCDPLCITAKVSGPQNAGPLDRRVRPEGQKGTPCLEEGRSPRKSAGPRKRRSAARRTAGGACCTSAGGPKGLKAFGTGPSAGTIDCAHEAGDGTNGRQGQ